MKSVLTKSARQLVHYKQQYTFSDLSLNLYVAIVICPGKMGVCSETENLKLFTTCICEYSIYKNFPIEY